MKRLLVVDDSPLVRRVVTDILGQDFDVVVQAADGQEGLEAAQRETPDLVLLDLEMPRLDGLDTCRALRKLPALKSTPIVILTSRDSELDVQAAFEAGVTDYLVKPFAPGLLRSRMRVWLLRGDRP